MDENFTAEGLTDKCFDYILKYGNKLTSTAVCRPHRMHLFLSITREGVLGTATVANLCLSSEESGITANSRVTSALEWNITTPTFSPLGMTYTSIRRIALRRRSHRVCSNTCHWIKFIKYILYKFCSWRDFLILETARKILL